MNQKKVEEARARKRTDAGHRDKGAVGKFLEVLLAVPQLRHRCACGKLECYLQFSRVMYDQRIHGSSKEVTVRSERDTCETIHRTSPIMTTARRRLASSTLDLHLRPTCNSIHTPRSCGATELKHTRRLYPLRTYRREPTGAPKLSKEKTKQKDS